ncbi:MAG: hypothetical protein FWD61_05505 [Phycisphaerales bacterium]|nr:hypothetical protein [Phycisphaerales bacterium]
MGIDCLEFSHRVEKEFGVKLTGEMLEAKMLEVNRKPGELTAEDVMRTVEKALRMAGKEVPGDGWPRMQKCIAETVCILPGAVSLDSRLGKDLGFS